MKENNVQDRHRPGLLKQQNKIHKHGRHRSKGEINNANKGRMSVKVITKQARNEMNRDERRNRAVQIRQNKRSEVLGKKRFLTGSANTTPFLTAIVPLAQNIDPNGILELLKQADEESVIKRSSEGNIHISIGRFRQRFTFVSPANGDLYAYLDALKVADTAMFVLSAEAENDGMDNAGEMLLTAILAQGLPSPIVTLTHLENLPVKKHYETKQRLQKVMSRWLPDVKIMPLNKRDEALTVIRKIGCQKQKVLIHREQRPHMLAESVDFTKNAEDLTGILKVTGFLRGQRLSISSAVHIPGWGDFQITRIEVPPDPYALEKKQNHSKDIEMEETRVIHEVDPNQIEPLMCENPIDPMDAEQTWPTAEELMEAEEKRKTHKLVKRIPKGMSEYQASWILDSDAEEESDESDVDMDGEQEIEAQSDFSSSPSDGNVAKCDTVAMSEVAEDTDRYDENLDFEEEKEMLKKIKEAREEQMFPDEYDTPQDVPARIRFQKYRGLSSFRTSPWDPKENLPLDYARIFQFENFDRMRKRIMKREYQDGALPDWYITVHVVGVPQHLWASRKTSQPLVLFGLLPHEHKMSLLNVVLKRPSLLTKQVPIKSKEQLIFHIGYRRFKACPIFSQHTNGTKHKYERFFQPDTTVVASMYAPIMFPPCSVLAFMETRTGMQELIGVGNVLSVNPDRIVAKRIVLSGHPFKLHKHSAVIRFMFFNRDDINWFKPVELRTKYGRRGHIKEPLGTHGHMKCVFDSQLKSQDTILMNLYKRVYPEWTYEPYTSTPPCLCSDKEVVVEEIE